MNRMSIFLCLVLTGLASMPAAAGCGCGMASCGAGAQSYSIPSAVDWGSRLSLDESQKRQLDQAFAAQGKGLRSLQQKRSELLSQLKTMADGNTADKAPLAKIQKQIGKVQREMERSRYEIWDRVADFLTPAQRAKFILANASEWPMQDLLASIQSAEAW